MRTTLPAGVFVSLLSVISLNAIASEKAFTRRQLADFTKACGNNLIDSIYQGVCGYNRPLDRPGPFGMVYLENTSLVSFGLYWQNIDGLYVMDDSNGLYVAVEERLCTPVYGLPPFALGVPNSGHLPHYSYDASRATPYYDQFGNMRYDLEQVRLADIAIGSDQNLSSAAPLINKETGRDSSVMIDTQKFSECLRAALE